MTGIDICNMALALVKQAGIMNINENNERARVCRLFYDNVRKDVLCRHDWNFARVREKLTELSVSDDEKVEGYEHYYQYPARCLKLMSLHTAGSDENLEINEILLPASGGNPDRRVILSNDEDLEAVYTYDFANETQFPSPFVRVFATTLATEICGTLTGNDNLARMLMQKTEYLLQNAENHNSAEYWGETDRESSTLTARSA